MSPLAKISWDPDRRIAQVWKRDRRGWFCAGWGFDVKGVAANVRRTGFRVVIVDHVEAEPRDHRRAADGAVAGICFVSRARRVSIAEIGGGVI